MARAAALANTTRAVRSSRMMPTDSRSSTWNCGALERLVAVDAKAEQERPPHVRIEPRDELQLIRPVGSLPFTPADREPHLESVLCRKRHHGTMSYVLRAEDLVIKGGSPQSR